MDDGPKPGFYRTRLKARGDWVPVRVWVEDGERCRETGALLSDQRVRCEIDGEPADPFEGDRKSDSVSTIPRYMFFRPIDEIEFDYLRAYRSYVKNYGVPEDKEYRYSPSRSII